MSPTTDIGLLMRNTWVYLSIPQTVQLSMLGSPLSTTTFTRIHYHEKSSWFPAEMSELLAILPNAELACEAMADFSVRLRTTSIGTIKSQIIPWLEVYNHRASEWHRCRKCLQVVMDSVYLQVSKWWLWSDELYSSEIVSFTIYPGHKHHSGTSYHFIFSLTTEKETKSFSLSYSCMYKQTSNNPIKVPLLRLFRSHTGHIT